MGKRRITALVFTGLALIAASALGFGGVWAAHKGFGSSDTGFISAYHQQPAVCPTPPPPPAALTVPCPKQDLSGVATDGNVIIFADDGGDPSDFNFIRVVTGGLPDNTAVDLPLTLPHKDLEGAVRWRGYFVVTTSLSRTDVVGPPAVDNSAFRRLTRFKLNEDNTALVDEKSVDLRAPLMAALEAFAVGEAGFGQAWFNRIKNLTDERAGALNVEGLSATRHPGRDALLLGFRGPLFGENFATCSPSPCGVNQPFFQRSLRTGVHIVAEVARPFSATPSFTFKTLDLDTGPMVLDPQGRPLRGGRHGVRGMGWVPAMQGIVLIGGPVARGEDFSLWLWDGDDEVERLDVEGSDFTAKFRQLCRPESVMQMEEGGNPVLVVFSEHSGAACFGKTFNFVKARIVPGS